MTRSLVLAPRVSVARRPSGSRALRLTACGLVLVALVSCAGAPPPPPTAPPRPVAASRPAPAPTVTPDASPIVPEAERWRSKPPAAGAAPEIVVPEIRQRRLANGLAVLVSERHDQPVVSVRVALRAGTADEPAGKDGLADLTYELMLEGAGQLDGVALADAFSEIGTSASVETDRDGASFLVSVLSRNLDPALGLLSLVLGQPRLAPADFARRQKEHVANLTQALGSPDFLLAEATNAAVYGAAHPYGRPSSGTPATVRSLSLTDVRAFYGAHVGPRTTAVILAGDITLEQAQALAQKHFGRWRARAKPAPKPAAVRAQPRREVTLVPKPGLGQTFIAVGRAAIPAGHPDEWRLGVANVVYGGMFSSRLNMNLREAKGYTYGARATLAQRRGAGALLARTSVQADKTGAALREIFAEVAGLTQRPVTDQELALARDGELRGVPGLFETGEIMAGIMASLFTLELPLDRVQRRVRAYRDLTREQVQRAAQAYFVPGLMQVVLVGDPAVVKAQVPALGLGEIRRREPPR